MQQNRRQSAYQAGVLPTGPENFPLTRQCCAIRGSPIIDILTFALYRPGALCFLIEHS